MSPPVTRRLLFSLLAAPLARAAPPLADAVETLVVPEIARLSVPGCTVALAIGEDIRFAAGYGFADVENEVPATAQTAYRTASIAKSITATALLQLVERRQFDLDAPIQQYVPAFPRKPWPVTARQLMTHTAGIRTYQNDAETQSTRHYSSVTSALNIFKDDPLVFEPGTSRLYTTYGYVLLGAALEAAAGVSYTSYVQRAIFNPAGMDHTRPDSVYDLIPHRAHGYFKTKDNQIKNCALADLSNKVSGGGLVSTGDDLVRFALAVNSGRFVQRRTLDEMWTPIRTRDGRAHAYGLGWELGTLDARRRVGHTGGQPGVTTHLALLPTEKIAVAVLMNLEGAAFEPLVEALLRLSLESQNSLSRP